MARFAVLGIVALCFTLSACKQNSKGHTSIPAPAGSRPLPQATPNVAVPTPVPGPATPEPTATPPISITPVATPFSLAHHPITKAFADRGIRLKLDSDIKASISEEEIVAALESLDANLGSLTASASPPSEIVLSTWYKFRPKEGSLSIPATGNKSDRKIPLADFLKAFADRTAFAAELAMPVEIEFGDAPESVAAVITALTPLKQEILVRHDHIASLVVTRASSRFNVRTRELALPIDRGPEVIMQFLQKVDARVATVDALAGIEIIDRTDDFLLDSFDVGLSILMANRDLIMAAKDELGLKKIEIVQHAGDEARDVEFNFARKALRVNGFAAVGDSFALTFDAILRHQRLRQELKFKITTRPSLTSDSGYRTAIDLLENVRALVLEKRRAIKSVILDAGESAFDDGVLVVGAGSDLTKLIEILVHLP